MTSSAADKRAFVGTKHISKQFSGVQALHDVSITLNRGEIRCLAGENGSGKSTFIKIIAGVVKPDAGEIIIDGKPRTNHQPIDAIHAGIQVIYQDLSLFPNLTIAENLALNTLLDRNSRLIRWREVRKIARRALEQIGLSIDLSARVADMSAAYRQLVAIARALLHDARLIIMDEPTTALTHREVDSLFRIIQGLQRRDISVLFVSHKLNEVLEISDAITVLRNGEKVCEGPSGAFDHGTLVYHMTGRTVPEARQDSPPAAQPQKPLLRVHNLSRKGAFADVSLSLRSGEVVGLAGLRGSGRTALALALFGLEPADAGTVSIDEEPVRIRSVMAAMRAGIAYVPEDRLTEGLFLEQSIERNVAVGLLKKLVNRWRLLDRRKVRDHVGRWIEDLCIKTPSAALPAQSLSGGNQQKVVLARWLATEARILLLNGPTVGVDVGSKAEILERIGGLARQGMGVLMISDDVQELLHSCGRILLMHRGRIVDELTAGEGDDERLLARMNGLR